MQQCIAQDGPPTRVEQDIRIGDGGDVEQPLTQVLVAECPAHQLVRRPFSKRAVADRRHIAEMSQNLRVPEDIHGWKHFE